MIDFLYDITQQLESIKLPYMLSGSLAMGFYTIQRTTRDIDLVVEIEQKDVLAIENIFKTDFYCHKPSIEEAIQRNGMFNVISRKNGWKIDFILRKNGEYDLIAFQRKKLLSLIENKPKLWVISLEDLIVAKLRWIQELKSERQIEDIENLLDSKDLDVLYLDYWIKKLDLNTYSIDFHK